MISAENFRMVYITTKDTIEASNIARLLVEAKLAACCQVLAPSFSIYRWNDKVQKESEVVLIVKTDESKLSAIESLVKKEHSYECPCIVTWNLNEGSEDYLTWLRDQIKE